VQHTAGTIGGDDRLFEFELVPIGDRAAHRLALFRDAEAPKPEGSTILPPADRSRPETRGGIGPSRRRESVERARGVEVDCWMIGQRERGRNQHSVGTIQYMVNLFIV
jgi:hypothetical protein